LNHKLTEQLNNKESYTKKNNEYKRVY